MQSEISYLGSSVMQDADHLLALSIPDGHSLFCHDGRLVLSRWSCCPYITVSPSWSPSCQSCRPFRRYSCLLNVLRPVLGYRGPPGSPEHSCSQVQDLLYLTKPGQTMGSRSAETYLFRIRAEIYKCMHYRYLEDAEALGHSSALVWSARVYVFQIPGHALLQSVKLENADAM